MIDLLEGQLLAALRKLHPAELDIKTGPVHPPSSRAKQMLAITVSQIECRHPALQEDSEHERNPAHQIQSHSLSVDGQKKDFSLPDTAAGEVVEIESPTGHLLRRGDDYKVEDRVVKFYQAPQEDIIVHLQGERRRGYREQQACRIALNIEVWTKKSSDADSIMQTSLAAILAYFVDISVITLTASQAPRVYSRLLKPVARLANIDRVAEKVGNTRFTCSIAHLYLYGELELNVALGAPKEEGVIEEIDYTIDADQKP